MDFNDLMATPTILLHRSPIYYFSFFFAASSHSNAWRLPLHPLAERNARNRAAGFTFDLDEMELLI
jgi:hypothetical protein